MQVFTYIRAHICTHMCKHIYIYDTYNGACAQHRQCISCIHFVYAHDAGISCMHTMHAYHACMSCMHKFFLLSWAKRRFTLGSPPRGPSAFKTCMYLHTSRHAYVHECGNTHTQLYKHIYIYTYTRIYMYIYI